MSNESPVSHTLLPWHEPMLTTLQQLPEMGTSAVYLYGPSGHGKRQLALTYAQWLLCEARPRQRLACGVCAGCQLLSAGQHPDLRIIVPESMYNEVSTIDRGAEGDEPTGKNPSKEIRIEDIRQLSDFAYTASHRGQARVILIWPAQSLNTNAANALLKTLEEPPAGLRFVLVGRSLTHVLPTIRSRCRLLPVEPADRQVACAWLEKAAGLDPEAARIMLSIAGGAPVLAQQLSAGPDAQLRRDWLKLLSQPKSLDVFKSAAHYESLGISVLAELAQRLLFDLTCLSQQHPPSHFDWLQPQLGWAQKRPLEELVSMQPYLLGVQRSAEHPLNAKLVIESLLNKWQHMALGL